MPKKAEIKYRSLRSNLVHVPLSLYAQLAQSQTRPQGIILHLSPLVSTSASAITREAYLGWSGLAAASSLGLSQVGEGKEVLETIEIDPEVGSSLGLAEGTIVEISIIRNPTKARSITVTPLTSDDWEILEQNASFLEENLLSQLRAAKKGQEIDVWVKGRTKIRIKVDETNPDTTTAVLLNADTEVYVAPRPRGSKSTSPPSVLQPTSTSVKGKEKVSGKTRGFKVRLIPGRIASKWGTPPSDVEAAGRVLLCGEDVVERVRRKFGVDTKHVHVKAVLRNQVEEEQADSGEANGAINGKDEGEKKDEGVECVLVPWEEMPDGCVVMTGKVEKGWEEWGEIRLSPGTPKSRKAKSAKGDQVDITLPLAVPSPRLAGVEAIVDQSIAYLRRAAVSDTPRPLLLTGAKGSGKTSLTHLIGEAFETDRDLLYETTYVDVARLDSDGRITKVKESMADWIENAKRRAPALLILDGIDTLLPPENELTPSSNTAALANHFCSLIATSSLCSGLLVVATATSAQSLHPMLNQRHIFGETIKIPPANKETRREILELLVQRQTPSSTAGGDRAELDYVTLASMTEGYTASDLKDLVGGALQQAVIRGAQSDEDVTLLMEDFTSAQVAFTPMSLRGVSLQKSDTKWSDIGGLQEPRRVLRETLEWPTRYAQIFANCPLRLRSGLLLYGYPGCGKTLLASAVAKECGLNFISVKGPEILNKYIGASEKSVRDLFERASAAKPCVLFFDEFDSIAPKRGHDSTGVTDRVVNQLLTEMDGAQGLDGVYVLAATSRPDLIDSALLRPGRLDKSLLCDMPSKEDRLEIIRAVSTRLLFDPSIDFDLIASDSEGLSGADLQAVVYNAHLEVVQASIAAEVEQGTGLQGAGKGKGKEVEGKGKGKGKSVVNGDIGGHHARQGNAWTQIAPKGVKEDTAEIRSRMEAILGNTSNKKTQLKEAIRRPTPVIEQRHLLKSLANTRPSVSPADRAKLHRIYSAFVSDREGSITNGDLGRETGTRASLM